jgi:lipopolysaccharide transport system permease protein
MISNLKTEFPADELVIEAGRTEKNYWRDLWRFRELFYFLAWRDILVRYKQTAIGIAWAVIRPFLTTVIFTVFASKLAGLKAPGAIPYALLVMAAMLPWQFFATAMSEASNSLINNSNLISKIYFPRLIVPASSVITSFVDFLITLGLMAGFMIWYQFLPDWHLLALPLFMALAIGASFGVGLWLCALNVEYRDFRYIVPFIVQFGMLISPVAFSSSKIQEKFGDTGLLLYSLNPMVGVIDGFRWALLRGETPLWWPGILTSILLTGLLCGSGIAYFRRMERTFADVI